jgi:broad specificity phosphatase PhoE
VSIHAFDGLRRPASFYLVRHGQSAGNDRGVVQGHTDLPLTDQGRAQAAATGRWFRDKQVDAILASPLLRARETAEIIASEAGLDLSAIILADGLKELDTGIFSGKSFEEVSRTHRDAWEAFRRKSWEAVPGAESIKSLMQRATGHWHESVGLANAGHPVIVSITHGGFFQWLFRASFNAAWQSWMPIMEQRNCGISLLKAEPVDEAPVGEAHRFYAEWKLINHTVW